SKPTTPRRSAPGWASCSRPSVSSVPRYPTTCSPFPTSSCPHPTATSRTWPRCSAMRASSLGEEPDMRTRFRPDRQLTVRMALTVFLLGLVYVLFVAVLISVLRSWVWVVVIAGGLLIAQYWFSDRIALTAMRARMVTPQEQARLHGIIDRLCATAD